MSPNTPWHDRGADGTRRAEAERFYAQIPPRLYLKSEQSRTLVVIDDTFFGVNEHQFRINDDPRNWCTCVAGIHSVVPCCDKLKKESRHYVQYLTVVDCTKWEDSYGNVRVYGMQLLPLKTRSQTTWHERKEEHGSLVGCIYKVTRTSPDAASSGDKVEFIRRADIAKLSELANYKSKLLSTWYEEALASEEGLRRYKHVFDVDDADMDTFTVRSFNYMSFLAPKSPKELEILLANATSVRKQVPKQDGNAPPLGANNDPTVKF